jgi:hypothetical protein
VPAKIHLVPALADEQELTSVVYFAKYPDVCLEALVTDLVLGIAAQEQVGLVAQGPQQLLAKVLEVYQLLTASLVWHKE